MTASSDHDDRKVADLRTAIDSLEELSVPKQVRVAMVSISRFLEAAAFEMAGDHEPEEVAEIMRMAARLERTASGMRLENGGSRTRKL